jgi:hypothetical protein
MRLGERKKPLKCGGLQTSHQRIARSFSIRRSRLQPILAITALIRSRDIMMRVLRVVALMVFLPCAHGATSDADSVRSADERRIQATMSGSADALSALLSDELHYAHADGRVQTKDQLIAALDSHDLKYLSAQPGNLHYQQISEGVGALSGTTRFVVELKGQRLTYTLRFLSVWRQEAGQWRLLSYQSARLDQK